MRRESRIGGHTKRRGRKRREGWPRSGQRCWACRRWAWRRTSSNWAAILSLPPASTALQTQVSKNVSQLALFQYPTVRSLAEHLSQDVVADDQAGPDSRRDAIRAGRRRLRL